MPNPSSSRAAAGSAVATAIASKAMATTAAQSPMVSARRETGMGDVDTTGQFTTWTPLTVKPAG